MNRIFVVDNEPDLRNRLTRPFSVSELLELIRIDFERLVS